MYIYVTANGQQNFFNKVKKALSKLKFILAFSFFLFIHHALSLISFQLFPLPEFQIAGVWNAMANEGRGPNTKLQDEIIKEHASNLSNAQLNVCLILSLHSFTFLHSLQAWMIRANHVPVAKKGY